jgi:hypothetical protein
MADKQVLVEEIGNGFLVQLEVWVHGVAENHGKPVAVQAGPGADKDLGAAVRKALSTRVRTRKEKKGEAAAA